MRHHTLDISHIKPLKVKRIGKIDIHIPKLNINELVKQTKLTIKIPNITRVIKKEVEKDIIIIRTEGIHLEKQIKKVEKQVEKEVITATTLIRNIEKKIETGAGDLLNMTLETLGNQSSNQTDTSNNTSIDTSNTTSIDTSNTKSIDTSSSFNTPLKTNYHYLGLALTLPLVFILI
jgi:hypothetical protein